MVFCSIPFSCFDRHIEVLRCSFSVKVVAIGLKSYNLCFAGELSLTNFDAKNLEKIIQKGFSISSNQIQYSIVDQRPKHLMKPVCDKYSVKILAYGALCK